MAGKLNDFLFPNKEKNELDSTTIVLNNEKTQVINNKTENPTIFSATSFAQVENLANQLLTGNSIIVDLNTAEITEAKRIVDFLNGVCFAIDGKVEKVARLIYLFSPR